MQWAVKHNSRLSISGRLVKLESAISVTVLKLPKLPKRISAAKLTLMGTYLPKVGQSCLEKAVPFIKSLLYLEDVAAASL